MGPWPSDEKGGLYCLDTNPKKPLAKNTEGAPLDRVRPSAGGRPAVGQGVQGSSAAPFNLSRVKVSRVNLILSRAEGCPERLFSHTVSETSKVKIDCLTKVWSKSENDFYGAKKMLSPGVPSPQQDRWQTKKPPMRSSSTCQTFIGTGVSLTLLFLCILTCQCFKDDFFGANKYLFILQVQNTIGETSSSKLGVHELRDSYKC